MNASVPKLAGWLEQASPDVVAGWAADINCPGKAVELAFYINGQRVAVTTCDQARLDAVDAGFDGARAFAINLRPWLKDGSNVLKVRSDLLGADLPNGNQTINVGRSADIGNYWSAQYRHTSKMITRWWECEYIVKRINRAVCGEALPGPSSGLHRLAALRLADRLPLARGVSIGSGTGTKELNAIRSGLVRHFTLFELSAVAVEQGRAQAAEAGLAQSMTFRNEDGLIAETGEGVFDLVYWNNALHHMFDVKAALEWSWRVLRKGGVLLMDDFVGPTRMQWSDQLLEINNAVRRALPAEYLAYPGRPGVMFQPRVDRAPVEAILASDPSECADSANILPELMRLFPDAWVKYTGGGVYHLALNDILQNITEAQDYELLERILEVDDECAKIGETHYAVAIAVK